jgi:hypothetical protein
MSSSSSTTTTTTPQQQPQQLPPSTTITTQPPKMIINVPFPIFLPGSQQLDVLLRDIGQKTGINDVKILDTSQIEIFTHKTTNMDDCLHHTTSLLQLHTKFLAKKGRCFKAFTVHDITLNEYNEYRSQLPIVPGVENIEVKQHDDIPTTENGILVMISSEDMFSMEEALSKLMLQTLQFKLEQDNKITHSDVERWKKMDGIVKIYNTNHNRMESNTVQVESDHSPHHSSSSSNSSKNVIVIGTIAAISCMKKNYL